MKVTEDDAEEIMTHLDRECWQCGGSGKIPIAPDGGRDCDICYGTGYQPTRAGIELLNFLRRQKKRIKQEEV